LNILRSTWIKGKGKENQGILIPIVAQHRPKHEGLGLVDKKPTQVQLKPPSSRQEELEKTLFPWGRRKLQNECAMSHSNMIFRGLEEGKKDMIPPSRSTPILGGSSNQVGKHHHIPKMYGIISLVCFYYKKGGHKASNFWHSRRPSNPCKNYF
jgi:hypothetical protein